MHTLWARAARTRIASCRCPSCLHNEPSRALGRRATTAAAGHRLLQPMTTSTFFFSTIFAAAMVVDGRRKRDRRKQWDAAIDQEKVLLEHVKESCVKEEERARREQDKEQEQNGAVSDVLIAYLDQIAGCDISKSSVDSDFQFLQHGSDVDWGGAFMAEEGSTDWEEAYKHSVEAGTYRPEWPANVGPDLNPKNLPPQSIYATDAAKGAAMRRRWTPKKIRTAEVSILRLVLRFMMEAGLYDQPESMHSSVAEPVQSLLRKDKAELEALHARARERILSITLDQPWDTKDSDPILPYAPFYNQDPDGAYHRNARDLNIRLYSLFRNCHPKKTDERSFRNLIAQVSNQLLTSQAPPNMDTYNILITELARLRADRLIDIVFSSFREANIRPNEITCAALLSHYTKRSDVKAFTRLITLMHGGGRGLMLARSDVHINADSAQRLVRKDANKVIQRVYPTPMVFTAMVEGLLKFTGLAQAVKVVEEMRKVGWGLDVVGLSHFLKQCAREKQWEIGLKIWSSIKSLASHDLQATAKITRLASPSEAALATAPRSVRRLDLGYLDPRIYFAMLRMCYACRQIGTLDDVLQEALTAGHSVDTLCAHLPPEPRKKFKDVLKSRPPLRETSLPSKFTVSGLQMHLGSQANHSQVLQCCS